MSLLEAARQGRREALEELRDRLSAEIDAGPEPRDLAALSIRLERVLAQLDELPGSGELLKMEDALAARRAAKQAADG